MTTGGVPVRVVLVVSHMAVDGWSLKIVCEDLRTLLSAPAALGPAAEQPLGRLAYENSERAGLRERRAFDYWAEAVRELPRVWPAARRSSPWPRGHGAGTGLPSTSARREKLSPP